jgi:hypothetical protein
MYVKMFAGIWGAVSVYYEQMQTVCRKYHTKTDESALKTPFFAVLFVKSFP